MFILGVQNQSLNDMKTNVVRELQLFMAITGFTNLTANANDGYFSTGYGAINKGFAGAGIAYYQGSLINGNPAGVVHLGTKYHLGLNLLHPRRKFTTSVPTVTFPDGLGLQKGTFESGSMYAVITNQVSVGFSKDLTKRRRGRYKPSGKEIHFAFNYALENTIKGINTMDTGQTIEIGMNLLELEMGFSF